MLNISGDNNFGVADYNTYFRDFDVNRLYFLLYRLIKGALNDANFAAHFGIDNTKILSLWYLVINLEGIADGYKDICLALKNITSKKDKFSLNDIEKVYEEIRNSYLDVMKAYYTSDKRLADDVASKRPSIIEKCIPFSKRDLNFDMFIVYENLKEIENLTCNIARIVIDEST